MDGTYEGKKNTDKWFPVRLVDATDLYSPEESIAFGSVTAVYGYEAATSETSYTVTTDDWKEQGSGNYWLRIGASEFTSEGKYMVNIEATGCHPNNFVVEVRDKTVAELIDDVVSILDDTGTSGVIVVTNNDKTGYGLADDAITASKFDESTAYPLANADSGSTAVARTGADSDTLETLSDQLDAVPTAAEIQAEMEENGASILDTISDKLPSGTISDFDESSDQVTVTTNNDKTGYSISGTKQTLDALNDVSAADVNTQCDTALTDYDPPTKTEMDTAHALLATPAQVNAQVLDVLNTDTFGEPGQEDPPATTTLIKKIGYLYKFMRNKIYTTTTTISIYDDAGTTVDQKSTISGSSSEFTRGEFVSGP